MAIEESKDLNTCSLEELLGSLQSHELRIKQFDSSPSEQDFQIQDTSHGGFRGRGGRGSFRGRGQGRGKVQSEYSSSYQRGEEELVEVIMEEEEVILLIFNAIIFIKLGI